jgi:hypothetical protein
MADTLRTRPLDSASSAMKACHLIGKERANHQQTMVIGTFHLL